MVTSQRTWSSYWGCSRLSVAVSPDPGRSSRCEMVLHPPRGYLSHSTSSSLVTWSQGHGDAQEPAAPACGQERSGAGESIATIGFGRASSWLASRSVTLGVSGRALFAGPLALGAAGPSPAAHLLGAIAGLVVALLPAPRSRRAAPAATACPATANPGTARGSAARVG